MEELAKFDKLEEIFSAIDRNPKTAAPPGQFHREESMGDILAGCVFYGLLAALGQFVRAIVGLGKGIRPRETVADQRIVFNVNYLFFTLLTAFFIGVVAGLVNFDFERLTMPLTPKIFLGIVAIGYAGTDFIENTYSRLSVILAGISNSPQPKAKAAAARHPPPEPDAAAASELAEAQKPKQKHHTENPPPADPNNGK